jgi:hypothetical protein
MVWYIHRMIARSDSYDPEEASRQAEELGLASPEYRKAATSYLDTLKQKEAAPVPVAVSPSAPAVAPASAPATAAVTSPQVPRGVKPAPDPAPGPHSLPLPDESQLPEKLEGVGGPAAAAVDMARVVTPARPAAGTSRDPSTWQPLLSLVLAGLGVPLAYFSRSVLAFRVRVRASLPGPRRRLRSLPAGSGE